MLEGRDRLLPSLASLAFPPQFPPVCRGSDRVIWGLRLMMHVKSQSGFLVHGSCPAPICYPLAIGRERSACSCSREKQSSPKFTPETFQAENQAFSTCGVSSQGAFSPEQHHMSFLDLGSSPSL